MKILYRKVPQENMDTLERDTKRLGACLFWVTKLIVNGPIVMFKYLLERERVVLYVYQTKCCQDFTIPNYDLMNF